MMKVSFVVRKLAQPANFYSMACVKFPVPLIPRDLCPVVGRIWAGMKSHWSLQFGYNWSIS